MISLVCISSSVLIILLAVATQHGLFFFTLVTHCYGLLVGKKLFKLLRQSLFVQLLTNIGKQSRQLEKNSKMPFLDNSITKCDQSCFSIKHDLARYCFQLWPIIDYGL